MTRLGYNKISDFAQNLGIGCKFVLKHCLLFKFFALNLDLSGYFGYLNGRRLLECTTLSPYAAWGNLGWR